jgi:putative membrane protein
MLPASEGWKPLHPLSPFLRITRFAVLGAVILSQFLDFVLDNPLLAFIAFIVFLIVTTAYGYVAWRFMGYRITDEHIEMRVGIFFRSHKRVPRARIESVDIARPLLPRLVGLSELRIEVASTDESRMTLQFLSEDEAEVLRQSLLRAASEAGASVEEESSTQAETKDVVVARVNFGELVIATVASSVVGLLLALVGLVIGLAVFALITGTAEVFGSLAFLGLAAVGVLIRAGTQVSSLYNFTLYESGEGLLIRRGLVSLLAQKVPLDRVQSIRIERPLAWRWFKRERLIVDIAGYRGGSAYERQSTSVLMPITTRNVTERIIARVLPGLSLSDFDFGAAPRQAKWRSPIAYRFYSVAMDRRFAATTTGVFRQQIDVIPHRKAQSLRVTRGPWQRALGLASLHIDSAGANIACSVVHRTEAEAIDLAEWSRRAQESA